MKYIKPRIPNKEIELCLDLFGKKEASKRIIEYITGVIDDADTQFNLLNTDSADSQQSEMYARKYMDSEITYVEFEGKIYNKANNWKGEQKQTA